jgi:hypothetical protein
VDPETVAKLVARVARVEKDQIPPNREVFVNSTWHVAKVLTWSGSASGWRANVRWWPRPGRSELGTFAGDQVRECDGDLVSLGTTTR